jgi:hypothetical protein
LNERTIKIPAQNAIITLKKFGEVAAHGAAEIFPSPTGHLPCTGAIL